jgi:hypothetical protein
MASTAPHGCTEAYQRDEYDESGPKDHRREPQTLPDTFRNVGDSQEPDEPNRTCECERHLDQQQDSLDARIVREESKHDVKSPKKAEANQGFVKRRGQHFLVDQEPKRKRGARNQDDHLDVRLGVEEGDRG